MTTLHLQWNVPEEVSNAVVWYEISYPGQGHETGKMITKAYVVYVCIWTCVLSRYDGNQNNSTYDATSFVCFWRMKEFHSRSNGTNRSNVICVCGRKCIDRLSKSCRFRHGCACGPLFHGRISPTNPNQTRLGRPYESNHMSVYCRDMWIDTVSGGMLLSLLFQNQSSTRGNVLV